MNSSKPTLLRTLPAIAIAAGTILTLRCGGNSEPSPSPGAGALVPPTLSGFSISPTTIVGGDAVNGNVVLAAAAPSDGATVTLSSDNQAVTVPGTVRVAAAATTATFSGTSAAVSAQTTVRLSATLGVTQSATLTLTPRSQQTVALSSLSLASNSVVGGNSVQGTVTLSGPSPSGGATVNLASSDASVATVPTTVAVGEGATSASFVVSTRAVGGTIPLNISASYNGATQTAALSVTASSGPVAPSLSSVSLTTTSVVGGSSVQGTVTLTGAAPSGGAIVDLSSSNTSAATVPATVAVAAGASSATFAVSTLSVGSQAQLTISGSYAGVTRTAGLTVTPITIRAVIEGPSEATACNLMFGDPSHCTDRYITMRGLSSVSTYPIVRYRWNCGQPTAVNCLQENNPTPQFLYLSNSNSGPDVSYTVTLTIEDDHGNQNTAMKTVTVRQRY